jgi:AcrR family transcriptional regulator
MTDDPRLIFEEARPKRADAVENRALLVQTAARLFAEKGIENVTMSAIAEAANVGKGTLYRHFENKIAITQALLDEDQRDLQARAFAQFGQERNAAANLRWFLCEALGFVLRNITLLRFDDSHTTSMLSHTAHWWWRMTIRALLLQAAISIDVDYATDTLYVLLDPRTVSFQLSMSQYDAARIEAGVLAVAERFLCASVG